MPSRPIPDRDRLSVISAVIVLAYALARFLDIPSRTVGTTLFGTSLGVTLGGQFVLLVLVAALISTGSDNFLRSHPKLKENPTRSTVIHWILPGATALALGMVLDRTPHGAAWWLGLAVSALFLVLVLMAEFVVVDEEDPRFGWAALGLTGLGYTAALTLFALARLSGARAAISATLMVFVAGVIALRLLVLGGASGGRAALYAGLIGLLMGEATWALNYWVTNALGVGLVMLVLFYLAVGASQQHLVGRLDRRVVVEFAVVGVVGLALALRFAFAG